MPETQTVRNKNTGLVVVYLCNGASKTLDLNACIEERCLNLSNLKVRFGFSLYELHHRSDIIKKIFDFLSEHPRIFALNLSNAGLSSQWVVGYSATMTLPEALKKDTQLSHVDLSNNPGMGVGVHNILQAIDKNVAIKSIKLDDTNITPYISKKAIERQIENNNTLTAFTCQPFQAPAKKQLIRNQLAEYTMLYLCLKQVPVFDLARLVLGYCSYTQHNHTERQSVSMMSQYYEACGGGFYARAQCFMQQKDTAWEDAVQRLRERKNKNPTGASSKVLAAIGQ